MRVGSFFSLFLKDDCFMTVVPSSTNLVSLVEEGTKLGFGIIKREKL